MKVGCFSVSNHCTYQSWITCEPCELKADYSDLGESGVKREKEYMQLMVFICLIIKQNGLYSLEIHGA